MKKISFVAFLIAGLNAQMTYAHSSPSADETKAFIALKILDRYELEFPSDCDMKITHNLLNGQVLVSNVDLAKLDVDAADSQFSLSSTGTVMNFGKQSLKSATLDGSPTNPTGWQLHTNEHGGFTRNQNRLKAWAAIKHLAGICRKGGELF